MDILNTTAIIIKIIAIPAKKLIVAIFKKPTPLIPRINEEESAKIPITGYIIIAKIRIIPKFFKALEPGLREGSIKPKCNPEDNLAPKILTKLPLSPENKGTKVNKLGLDNKVSAELFKIPPEILPKIEQINKTGVDCLTIVPTLSFDLNP